MNLLVTGRFLALVTVLLSCAHGFQHPRVECQTTKGPLVIEVYRDWAPLGADRFLELVQDNFYTDIAFFRCVKRFLTQFGISDVPSKKHWHNKNIRDDPSLNLGIKKNYISYAGGGPNTRSTQLFIAFEDLDFLGKEPWETPFGQVIEGQSTLDALYKGYGDIPPFGKGVDQQKIHNQGNAYVRRDFPETDFLLSCHMMQESEPAAAAPAVEAKKEVADAPKGEVGSEGGERSSEGGGSVVDSKEAGTPSLRSGAAKSLLPLQQQQVNSGKSTDETSLLDRRRSKHGREEELIIKAVLLLAVSLTILFVYMRYNVVGPSGKKL